MILSNIKYLFLQSSTSYQFENKHVGLVVVVVGAVVTKSDLIIWYPAPSSLLSSPQLRAEILKYCVNSILL